MSGNRLHIKRITPEQYTTARKKGGGENKPLKTVTAATREELLIQLSHLEGSLERAPSESPFIPFRVQLEENAIAKSHWPHDLFPYDLAPIIGAGKPGELFVQLSSAGLDHIKRKVGQSGTKETIKSLSTIQRMEPISRDSKLGRMSAEEILKQSPKLDVNDGHFVLIELFKYLNPTDDKKKLDTLIDTLSRHKIEAQLLYKDQNRTISARCKTAEDINFIADQVMVQQVQYLPCYMPIDAQAFNKTDLVTNLNSGLPSPGECPIVAVVDTGLDHENTQLSQWIVGHEDYVPKAYKQTDHGTFVAGLIIWGDKLNTDIPSLEAFPCRILDVNILPGKPDEDGNQMPCTEPAFFAALEDAVRKHHREIKVWNLSLSGNAPVDLSRFSSGAIELDDLQERYGISIVIAAGNYANNRQLPYPRSDYEKECGRITAPGDSVLGITTGSIAHVGMSGAVNVGEPSPFSRNGPGPNYIIKPDVSHYGGNMQIDAPKRPIGLTSTISGNQQADDIGTSFSTPLLSRQLAYIYHTINPEPSATLARAILTHSARDMRDPQAPKRVPDEDDHYLGFGTPVEINKALECDPWTMTMVFEETLQGGVKFIWDDFPFPECLINEEGKFTGEIWMTLAYPPKRGKTWGSEYCETHVSASFGVVSLDKEGKEKYNGKVPLEHTNKGELYERFQVQKLRKWAPVRTYHKLIPEGIGGLRWRLMIDMITRHEFVNTPHEQPFTLILTIADPEKRKPVYNEMTTLLANRLQTQNINLRTQVRNRA